MVEAEQDQKYPTVHEVYTNDPYEILEILYLSELRYVKPMLVLESSSS